MSCHLLALGGRYTGTRDDMQHVFISYKNEDLAFAENVISRLEKAGFTTWADSKIGAGEEWRTAIDLASRMRLHLS